MAPPSVKKTKQQDKPKIMRFRLDGAELRVEFGAAMTPRLERELFLATGLTIARLGDAMVGGANFAVPALVFIARRQAGEIVQYQDVEDAIERSAASEDGIDLELLGDDEGGDAGPPAQDAS